MAQQLKAAQRRSDERTASFSRALQDDIDIARVEDLYSDLVDTMHLSRDYPRDQFIRSMQLQRKQIENSG